MLTPFRLAADVNACRVEWAENIEVSIPLFDNTILIQRLKDCVLVVRYGLRYVMNNLLSLSFLRVSVLFKYAIMVDATHSSG